MALSAMAVETVSNLFTYTFNFVQHIVGTYEECLVNEQRTIFSITIYSTSKNFPMLGNVCTCDSLYMYSVDEYTV